MDALIDTNVLITYVTDRDDPYREAAGKVMELCANGVLNGSMAFHSLSTLWYVLRKYPEHERREWLLQMIDLLTVAGADNNQVREAIENEEFRDFEDCLQYECAKSVGADYIITANPKDYRTIRDVVVVTPDQAVAIAGTGNA